MKTATSLARIYADEHGLKHRDLTEKLIGLFFSIYNELGHGFLESVYEQAFSVALAENKISFRGKLHCQSTFTAIRSEISGPIYLWAGELSWN